MTKVSGHVKENFDFLEKTWKQGRTWDFFENQKDGMDEAAIPTPYLQQSSIKYTLLAILKSESESSRLLTMSFNTVVFDVTYLAFPYAWPCFYFLHYWFNCPGFSRLWGGFYKPRKMLGHERVIWASGRSTLSLHSNKKRIRLQIIF